MATAAVKTIPQTTMRWLRFQYLTPVENHDPEGEAKNVAGYTTFLRAIRSDGIMYATQVFTETEPQGEELTLIRKNLRRKLETYIADVPRRSIIPHPNPENWMKGLQDPNGDDWLEAEQ